MIVRNINTLLIATFLLLSISSFGQMAAIRDKCESHMTNNYISDGQEYRTLLTTDDIGEFRIVFYGGSTYRLATASSADSKKLFFTVYDEQRNELFSNRDHSESPYWDFEFNSTMTCVIETQLPEGTSSGVALLLVSFKQE